MDQKLTVAVCYEPPLAEHGADLQDILEQVSFVQRHLSAAGYFVRELPYKNDPVSFIQNLKSMRPYAAWNLFETFGGAEERQNLGAALLEIAGIPYTGSRLNAITTCMDKRTVKALLTVAGVPTPEMYPYFTPGRWILKPAKLHGSVGITEKSVVDASSASHLAEAIAEYPAEMEIFAERYIEGREFSVAMLDTADGLKTVALAEMRFMDYKPGEPRILSFDAKWAEESTEYKRTVRSFELGPEDGRILENIKTVADKTAALIGLEGFARIDFRCDSDNRIWVIDVNPNPGLGDDAGFIAACAHAGLTPAQTLSYIVKAAQHIR